MNNDINNELQYCLIKKDISPSLVPLVTMMMITELLLFKPSIKCFKCSILFNSHYIETLFSAFSWENQSLKDRLAQYQSWYNILRPFYFFSFFLKRLHSHLWSSKQGLNSGLWDADLSWVWVRYLSKKATQIPQAGITF